jgi:threonine dehydratase
MLSDIQAALAVVRPVTQKTPIVSSSGISAMLPVLSGELLFKAENFQRTGSFKIRGAYQRLSRIPPDQRTHGVIAASAGNHAQGVALAANMLGIPATVVMPQSASIAKIKATESYGARVVLTGQSFDDAQTACHEMAYGSRAAYIPAFDDDDIIAGQGTLGLELLDDVDDIGTVLVPIGGGGLFAGVAVALKESRPGITLVGVQSEGANGASRSFAAGRLLDGPALVDSICDGIAVKAPSPRTFVYIQKYADDVVEVPDTAVAAAMLLLLERTKMMVEPSAAVGLAALMLDKVRARGKTVVLLTGGNVDMLTLTGLMERTLLRMDRYLHITTACRDLPGALADLLEIVARGRGNVVSIRHNRLSQRMPLGMTGLELLIETRDRDHGDRIVTSLTEKEYSVERLP